ncbi:MAG: hypothetical protein CM15mP51_22340 [Porticoccaceae bacterium]|nr:MAG: hypothetical protein CM15mP51_22340 [Porticoccaceae bacterium]
MNLLSPFAYEYMITAITVSSLVGGVCGFLSAYLMLKGWSLIGDALSHSIVPGVAGAYILGLPLSLGAFFLVDWLQASCFSKSTIKTKGRCNYWINF